MGSLDNFNALKELTVSGGAADDLDIAIRIGLKKPSTVRYVGYTDPTFTLTDDGGVRTITAIASNGLASTTVDLINATEYWKATLVACRRDHPLDTSGTQHLLNNTTYAATNIPDGGVNILWDTSQIKERRICLGQEMNVTYGEGLSTPFAALTSEGNLGLTDDPTTSGEAVANARRNFNPPYKAHLASAYGIGTHAAGTSYWSISACGQTYDNPAKTYTGAATTVASSLGPTNQLGDGLVSEEGERFVICYGESTAITSSTINVQGQIGT